MKTLKRLFSGNFRNVHIVLFLLLLPGFLMATSNLPEFTENETDNYIECKGIIIDRISGSPLAFANVTLQGTNISTVANSDGEFSLKVLKSISNPKIAISFIGFKSKLISIEDFSNNKTRIVMEPTAVELPELSVISRDAEALMKAVFEKKALNYPNELTRMTAFYREAIRKNRTYVSLSEAVVDIDKQPYNSYKTDVARLFKARKKADYSKLDTITFKLQGGPFNSLYLDVMKNPDLIFTEDMFKNYEFSFDHSTHIDNRLIYVLDFKQREGTTEPLYFGKLYIDAENLALKSAVFKLNLSNKDLAAQMFIVRKPLNAKVSPIEANYRIDFNERNGKWFYGYSRIEFGLKINWKRKLFNTNYFSTIEMAVTDWKKADDPEKITSKERLRHNVIVSDEASGFSDPQFWGAYNVIEPEKPIESAIKKIQKQLEKK